MEEYMSLPIGSLPDSPTILDKETVKKIRRLLPVPNEHRILWADIGSFGGYPSGVVITDRAIILKASREEAKKNKQLITKLIKN